MITSKNVYICVTLHVRYSKRQTSFQKLKKFHSKNRSPFKPSPHLHFNMSHILRLSCPSLIDFFPRETIPCIIKTSLIIENTEIISQTNSRLSCVNDNTLQFNGGVEVECYSGYGVWGMGVEGFMENGGGKVKGEREHVGGRLKKNDRRGLLVGGGGRRFTERGLEEVGEGNDDLERRCWSGG